MASFRTRRCLPLIGAALVAASCSAPTDLVVTASQQSERTPRQTSTIEPIDHLIEPESPIAPAETFGPADLVLVESDLPGWVHSGPRRIDAEETFVAIDCPQMNTVWEVAGMGGMRSRGTVDGASFRDTAVRMPSRADAAAVLDAADIVWSECPEFAETSNSWSTEPLEMPTGRSRSAGLLLSTQGVDGWAIGLWQVDDMVVVLEVQGSKMWSMIGDIFETQQARADGTPQTLETVLDEPSSIDDIQPPVELPVEPPVESLPGTSNPPATNSPVTAPAATDDAWMQHRLARLVPDPAELIGEWTLRGARAVEAAPADPANAIPGCETEVPPTLDGINVSYQSDSPTPTAQKLEYIVSTGSVTDAQVLVDAFRAVPGCDLATVDFPVDFVAADFEVIGADDSIVLIGTSVATQPSSEVWVVIAARTGDVLIAAFFEKDLDELGPVVSARHMAGVIAEMITRI